MKSSWIAALSTVLTLGIGLGGCRIEPTEDHQPIRPFSRMIEESTESRFDVQTIRAPVHAPISDLIIGGTEGWSATQGDPVTYLSDRIEIAAGKEFVSLVREVAWHSDEIDALQLTISNVRAAGRPLRAYWAGPSETFSESRMSRAVETTPGDWVVMFVGHPEWSGRVSRIRVDCPAPVSGTTIMGSIQPIRFEYDLDQVTSAVGSYWKIDLNGDLRDAGLVSAQRPLEWTIDEPRSGFLEFSYGFFKLSTGAIQLDVAVRNRDGEWASVFKAAQLDVATGSGSDWQEARIDVRPHGLIHAVKFELIPEKSTSRFAGLGVVANPVMLPAGRSASATNVVLISLDTLRADRLSTYGYDRVTSPKLDSRTAKSGVLFRNTVAPSPRTLPSHTTILTGLDCVSHGVNHHSPAPVTLQTLAEVVRNRGYRTVATVGGGLLNPSFGLAQGFDEFFHYAGWAGGFEELEVELDKAFEKLERIKNQPFFMFFHTYEIHDPFHERAPFSDGCFSDSTERIPHNLIYGALPRQRMEEEHFMLSFDLMKWEKGKPMSSARPAPIEDLALVNCLYDSAIAYADFQIDRLLSRLDELGVLDTTLVVVTSDHGESLGEKGLYKHAYLYENNLMVPLIIFLPGGQYGGSVVQNQIGSVDIFPTILEVLGIEVPTDLDGRSLLPLIRGEDEPRPSGVWSYAGYENRGISLRVDNQVKYIMNNAAIPGISGSEEFFQLSNDPEEHRNMALEDPDTCREMRHRLSTYYRSRTTGAILLIENTDCEVVRGMINTENLVTHLKAVDSVSGKLYDLSENSAAFNIEKSESLQLVLEDSNQIGLELEGVGCGPNGAGATWQQSIDLSGGGESLFMGLSSSGWLSFENAESLESGKVAARVTLGGAAQDPGQGRDALDEEAVFEQLRSLGYIQ